MTREIKFRAWDKSINKMASFEKMQLNARFAIDVGLDSSQFIILPKHDNVTLMQFTGLHDKNGKEIYEGDCLVMDGDKDAVFEVFYHDGKGAFDCARVHYHNSRCGTYVPSLNSNRLEIIGNIYENEDLIK